MSYVKKLDPSFGKFRIPILPPDAALGPYSQGLLEKRGKVPGELRDDGVTWRGFPDWTNNRATEFQVERWALMPGAGIGVIGEEAAGVDGDVTDEPLAKRIKKIIIGTCGVAPCRTGQAPKFLLPYRVDEALAWAAVTFWKGDRETTKDKHVVELRGGLQQWVACGLHPHVYKDGSRREYTWDRAPKLGELTHVTRSQLNECFAKIEALAKEYGYQTERKEITQLDDLSQQAGQDTRGCGAWADDDPRWLLERAGGRYAPNGFVPNLESYKPRAIRYLAKDAPVAVAGAGGEPTTLKVARKVLDLGFTPPVACELMMAHWSDRCSPPWEHDELLVKVIHAWAYQRQNEIGCDVDVRSSNEAFGEFAKSEGAKMSQETEAKKAKAEKLKQNIMYPLETGSDIELAAYILGALRTQYDEIVHTEGAFHFYNGQCWTELTNNVLRRTAHSQDGRTFGTRGTVKLSQSRINSILNEMGVMCSQPDFFATATVGMNCANGFIEFDVLGAPRLVPHSPNQRARHVIPSEWHPDIDWTWEAPLLIQLLDGCFKKDADKADRIALLGEVCGAAALGYATKVKQPKAIVMHGPQANNGKTEILQVIGGVLPPDAITAVSPSQFDQDPMFIRLRGKLLNAVGEVGTSNAISSDAFKGAITGDIRTARDLYKPAQEIRPIAQHVMATNSLPPFHGGFDNGVKRRLIVLPLTRVIPEEEMVINIGKRIIIEENKALLAFVVDGASRLIRQGGFTVPPSAREALSQWVYRADPVFAWLSERTEYLSGHQTPQRVARHDFQQWAYKEGFDPKHLPGPPQFAARVLAIDGRLDTVRNNIVGRSFVGLRIRPDEEITDDLAMSQKSAAGTDAVAASSQRR